MQRKQKTSREDRPIAAGFSTPSVSCLYQVFTEIPEQLDVRFRMLEITSPGPLPDLLSFQDLGTGRSEIRNRILAPIFKDMKLIEAWAAAYRK